MRLSAREKFTVATGGLVLLGMAFWLGVWEPVQARLDLWQRRVDAKRAEYRQVKDLAARFARLRSRIERIESHLRRSRNFSILSYLENLAKRQGLQEHIVQMKPKGGGLTRYYRETAVEIKMEKVRLKDLVRYLFQVENSPELLRIKQLRIHPRFDDPNLLDVRFQVAAYELVEGR